ncbi:hypothetical protein BsIDN1_60520 [Bacillus safensis]|uniref:Uncharacterized protein n=1 Tax=Bacillus safensis TaxID=561879 RepID=A0A5S9MJT2_BACIA|nr:hypothetical protein BsIDN1_60520 [Bacillus safensis]
MRYAVNYPLFHQKELDDKIQSYANSALEHFKKTFSEAKDIDENKRYELNIDYEMVHYAKAVCCHSLYDLYVYWPAKWNHQSSHD